METLNYIQITRNYGSRNITRGKLSSLANIRFEVADRFYNGEIERMDIDVLAKICYVLDCNVGDVIEYIK